MHETSCGAVIFREVMPKGAGNPRILYLLLQYEKKHWDFVKGHVEKGESEQETARRETEEETGITNIAFVPGFRERIHYFYTLKSKTMSKDVFFFLAETKTEEVKLSHEHTDFAWLEFKEALAKLTFENAKEILKKARKFLKAQ